MPLTAAPVETPAPRADWLAATKRAWLDLWSSSLASTIIETDLPALDRYFTTLDEHTRATRAYRRQRLVIGSKGQLAIHPMGKHARDLAVELRQMEDRFGLTPMSRLKLGHQWGSTAMTLDDLNKQLEGADADPRLRLVDDD